LFHGLVKGIDAGSAMETNSGSSKRQAQPGASAAEVARRYGIDQRVLRRWKQELARMSAPTFVTVQITDADCIRCGADP
jgi:hypothetical protein